MQCEVHELTCSKGHTIRYNGREDHIFFNSPSLGIGEELFWDFHGWMDYGKLSFTKFCQQKNDQYKSTNPNSAPFVSNHTFIELFFSWIARMGIDFRQEVDPWCGHDPAVLACDGTHIGVSLKLSNLRVPITKPELQDQKPEALHQINHRCFLPYPHFDKDRFKTKKAYNDHCQAIKAARTHLLLICCRILKEKYDLVEDEQAERVGDSALVAVLKNSSVVVRTFVNMLIKKELHPTVMKPSAQLLKMLLKQDAALSQFFPLRFHNHLEECLEAVQASDPRAETLIQGVNLYGMEIAAMLKACQTSNTDFVVNFLREMMNSVIKVHSEDRPVAPANPIPGTYNPPSGIAYYFTEHGQQLREMPNYIVNDSEQDQKNQKDRRVPPCTKSFPGVSTGGWGYMFLFFCPIHGHCYGFHLVDGAEGRKDPFSALYKYKPTPPKEVFYDFACQFQEYSLNREPDFFKWVRVWHDLFHGCNHTCVPCFKSDRIMGLSYNTEICEQFNSYLQSIKFTGSHLSQINFMLFVQFMIFLWNRDKTTKFKKMTRVALDGLK